MAPFKSLHRVQIGNGLEKHGLDRHSQPRTLQSLLQISLGSGECKDVMKEKKCKKMMKAGKCKKDAIKIYCMKTCKMCGGKCKDKMPFKVHIF